MSRTEELMRRGARARGGTGSSPFIKWPSEYAYVEGRVVDHWTGDYGDVAVLKVTAVSDGLEAGGKDDGEKEYRVRVETEMEVNVGLSSATLQGTIREDDKGKVFHVAFEGWDKTRTGGREYRVFRVLEIPEQDDAPSSPENPATGVGAGPGAPGAEQPPLEEDGIPF